MLLPPFVALAAGRDADDPDAPAPEAEPRPSALDPEAAPDPEPAQPVIESVESDWTSDFTPSSGAEYYEDSPAGEEPEAGRRAPRPAFGAGLALVGVLVLIALVVTFAFLRQRGEGDAPDLLTVAAERAEAAQVAVATADAEEAHRFILDQFGWPLEVPRLAAAALVGVGLDPLAEGVELPFLRYQAADGRELTVYAFDYAFLDAAARQVQLAPAVYAHLADAEALDVRRHEGRYLVVWRRRAAIYAAVTDDGDTARLLADEVRVEG